MLAAPQEAYEKALAQYPRSADVRGQFAEYLLGQGQAEAAAGMAASAVELDPNHAVGWFIRGSALKSLCRFGQAIDAFERIVALVPGHAATHLSLGNSYAELGLLAQAEENLKDAIRLEPALKEAHASLGSVYIRQNRPELAEVPSRRALELDPDLIAAHQNLAGILAKSKPEEARLHRDAAYRQQQIFIEPSPNASHRCLMLTTADSGNIPYRHLLPKSRYEIIKWFIEYAPPQQAAALPPYDFVFNAIGDADFTGPTERPVREFLESCRQPVINDPAKVARTGRSATPGLLGDIPDVMVPPVMRFDLARDKASPDLAQAGIKLPVIMRSAGSHGGEGLRYVADENELAAALPDYGTAYITQYADYRSSGGWYRKYRVIFIDRRPYPCHLAIGPDWLLHHGTSGMAKDAARRNEEQRFLDDPEGTLGAKAWAALAAIGARLDLDYAGLDFSILPDGRILVFEANATMLVHPEDDPLFTYKNPAAARILGAFGAMIERRLNDCESKGNGTARPEIEASKPKAVAG